jgi:hypothetical protein
MIRVNVELTDVRRFGSCPYVHHQELVCSLIIWTRDDGDVDRLRYIGRQLHINTAYSCRGRLESLKSYVMEDIKRENTT